VDEIDICLKNHPCREARAYLSEDDFQARFSPLHKLYYLLARPVIPLGVRHWLQRTYANRIQCRAQFICDDLVETLKSDEAAWNGFVGSLYPKPYETAVLITHDVETQKGYDFIPKVIELERAYGFRGSWNLVARKYTLRREITELIETTGNEIGVHGFNHDGTDYYSERRFLERAVHVNEALSKLGAVGFRSPQMHRNLRWLQHLDILYDASCFDYDPYQPFPGGPGSIWPFMAGKFVELPYTLPQDHVLFYLLGEKDISVWKKKAAWVAANHGMILTLTHPDYLMERDHLRLYEELLAYLKEIPNVWHCLPREMAGWYTQLPERGERNQPKSYPVIDETARMVG
jgi:peptidoglycan/xylan/chitin deacetylase (PgdA/CDA1 family)